MRHLLSFMCGIALALCVIEPYYLNPAVNVPVSITVTKGDTLEGIIYRLKKEYNDRRDWRKIAFAAKERNQLGRWIYPGQIIVFEMEAR